MKIFAYDGPLITTLNKLIDYVMLGLLWVLYSVPLITIGASTSAMLFTAENRIYKGKGKMLPMFWKRFRADFKQASLLWLIQVLMIAFLGLNLFATYALQLPKMLLVLHVVVGILVLSWMQLWFAYLSRFHDNIRTLLSNTFYIALKHLPYALVLLLVAAVTVAGAAFAVLGISSLILLIPGVYALLSGGVFRKIFSEYMDAQENSARSSE